MNLTLFFVFLTFTSGLFLLLSGVMHLPTLRTSRVMMDTGREGKKLSKTLDALFLDGAVRLSPYIRINAYKRSRMNSVLKASGMGMTPEIYTAYAYIKAGRVFPLIARPGGVLERPGHTEAAVDLARLAGLPPGGVLCEILSADGTMARVPELLAFCREFKLRIGSVEALAAYLSR